MQYLIAIDSDGTLRKSDGTISLRTKKIIKKIVSSGDYVVLSTARPRYHTQKISEEANASDYLISSNGTEIFDIKKGEPIFTAFLNKSDCLNVYKYATKENIRIIFVVDNTEYATQFVRNENQKLLPIDIEKFLNENQVKQCMIIGKERTKLLECKNYITQNLNINIVDSSNKNKEEMWFSIIDGNASKGNAVKKLAEYLNIPLSNTVAIGNDYNDLSMFKVAGKSVAVDNAKEEIKSEASIIIESNDSDGVAKFLEILYNK